MPPPLDGYLRPLHAEAMVRDTADTWQRLAGQDHTYAVEIAHRGGHPSPNPVLEAPDKP